MADNFNPVTDNLETFNPVLGGRDAIWACVQLGKCVTGRKPWLERARDFLDKEVFVLADPNQQASTDVQVG